LHGQLLLNIFAGEFFNSCLIVVQLLANGFAPLVAEKLRRDLATRRQNSSIIEPVWLYKHKASGLSTALISTEQTTYFPSRVEIRKPIANQLMKGKL
jgi:hypothetical protein